MKIDYLFIWEKVGPLLNVNLWNLKIIFNKYSYLSYTSIDRQLAYLSLYLSIYLSLSLIYLSI